MILDRLRIGPGGAALLLGAALFVAPAAAATTPIEANATLISPLSLLNIADLDFATLQVAAFGTATINPQTGILTTTGGVTPAGGTTSRAIFTGAAARTALIWIQIPTGTRQLVRQGGTEVLALNNFTLDPSPFGPLRLVGTTPFTFGVGATLTVPGNAVEGLYSGTFPVTINYY